MEFALKVEDIRAAYQEKIVLDNINLQVRKGEFIGIAGPNGSGKTTLLRILTGILSPINGEVYLKNKSVRSYSRKLIARQMAVVPQVIEANFPLSAREVVGLGRFPYQNRLMQGDRIGQEVTRKVIETLNIENLLDENIANLSGGEKQRVFLGQALVQEPEILILDEPTTHLDISYQLELLEMVKEKQKEGLTVIAVFHDLNLACQYCSQIVLLNDGRIFTRGKPEEVFNSENISDVFGVEVEVSRHPGTGKIYIHSVSRKTIKKLASGKWVHLVCGMGSGSRLMRMLYKEGHKITCGVINVLDTDEETAENLGLDHIAEAPFSEITEDSDNKNKQLMKKSDYIILQDIPFGPGNIKNLEAVFEAARKGQKVILIEKNKTVKRDFTDGKATVILNELRNNENVKVINDESELPTLLGEV